MNLAKALCKSVSFETKGLNVSHPITLVHCSQAFHQASMCGPTSALLKTLDLERLLSVLNFFHASRVRVNGMIISFPKLWTSSALNGAFRYCRPDVRARLNSQES